MYVQIDDKAEESLTVVVICQLQEDNCRFFHCGIRSMYIELIEQTRFSSSAT